MQAVRELDDYDGAFAGRTQKAPDDSSPGLAANFSQHYVHVTKLAYLRLPAKAAPKNPAFLSTYGASLDVDPAAAVRLLSAAKRRVEPATCA